MPRVSVIVPARNAGAYLGEALASVAAQTFGEWEVVLVDDASTDATSAVAESYGEQVRVLRSEHALGPARARNLGIEQATADLIATLDADDLWTPQYLQRQLAFYERARRDGARIGVVCCDARLLEPSGLAAETFADRVGHPGREVTLDDLLRSNVVFTSVLAPRAVIREVGGYDPHLHTAEDYDLWLRVREAGYKILWNPAPLAVYRLRAESLGAHGERLALDTASAYSRALARNRLTFAQRRIARRQRRLYRVLAQRAALAEARAQGDANLWRRLALLPRAGLVALEHPRSWARWIRRGGPRRLVPGAGLR